MVHYDADLALGHHSMSIGGRTKHNLALTTAAAALKAEGFSRVGLGVRSPGVERTPSLFVQGFRGIADERVDQYWLVNRLTDAQLDLMRVPLAKVAQELAGHTRAGSVFDTAHRM